MKLECVFLVASVAAALPLHCRAQDTNPSPLFSTIYAFGDCLTDTHNEEPVPFYSWQGRYSNGPMWIEYLSTNLNLTYEASNNYAIAASRTLDVLAQISTARAFKDASNALFAVWAGPVDFYYNVLSDWGPPVVFPTNSAFWDVSIAESVNNLSNAVVWLYAKGARSFLVPNIDDVSRQPILISEQPQQSFRDPLRQRVQQFNSALSLALGAIRQSHPDVRIVNPDVFGLLSSITARPADYGMTKAFPAAMQDSSLTDTSFNGPGADYVFWDQYGHPTTKGHALIAGLFFASLTQDRPESVRPDRSGTELILGLENLMVGRNYTLQASPNLRDWQQVLSFTATAATNQFSVSLLQTPLNFYRLSWLP